jgi:hypothetical protein
MSFQVQSGAVAYWRGGSANNSLARLESAARADAANRVSPTNKTVRRTTFPENGFMMSAFRWINPNVA